ncbi:hypothetical protein [Butyrivibrio sp. AC2005]|uniref:hypothetical protein n=1 Tax=Butyrivibrio sp. AC2005 TaxID=1280672 RepID=UPI0004127B98|nr:hypothetical protein [Butyrivibrio sp. AC2005]
MDKSWSENNKEIQKLLTKEATFKDAIQKLLAITLMIAESNPDEKDIMTAMVMNLLRI